MKTFRILFLFILIPLFISCKDDVETTVDQYEVLSDYLVEQNMDLPDILNNWIVGTPDEAGLSSFINDNYIMDLRSADAFNAGHIEGAVNTSLATLLDDANRADKPIVVACYTGQTAGHAVVALRLMGYSDARVLKFGMSGWHSSLSGPWASNIGDATQNFNSWTFSAPTATVNFANQKIVSTYNGPELMLQERVEFMLGNGFQGINNTDVLANPSAYFINNFWSESDMTKYGHIEGAYRIQPLSLENGEIDMLNNDRTIVTYCWTGQTSSMVTAYLTVLGFDAKSLKFGTNGMIYNQLESHKFTTPTFDLPVVSTE